MEIALDIIGDAHSGGGGVALAGGEHATGTIGEELALMAVGPEIEIVAVESGILRKIDAIVPIIGAGGTIASVGDRPGNGDELA